MPLPSFDRSTYLAGVSSELALVVQVPALDGLIGPLPADLESAGGHGIATATTVEPARSLESLSKHLVVVGVEGPDFIRIGLTEGIEDTDEGAVHAVMEVARHA